LSIDERQTTHKPKIKTKQNMQPSVTSKKTPSLRAIASQSQNHPNPKIKTKQNMQPSVTFQPKTPKINPPVIQSEAKNPVKNLKSPILSISKTTMSS